MNSAHLENRKKHAVRLWSEYTDAPSPRQLDKWIAQRLKGERKFGSQDRRFYSNILFSTARYLHTFLFRAHCARHFKLKNLGQYQSLERAVQLRAIESFSRASATEDGSWVLTKETSCTELLDFVFESVVSENGRESELELFQKFCEKHFFAEARAQQFPDSACLATLLLAHGIPAAWSESLMDRIRRSGWDADKTFAFICGQNKRAPLWIRINHLDRKSAVEQDLLSQGLKVFWNGDCAAAVEGSFGLYQCASFKDGLFEIQDLASQQIAAAVKARPGEKVWDACAGGGGKTVALAAELRGKGALYASDIRDYKLDEVRRRTQRAGFHNVRTMSWNGVSALSVGKEVALQSGFDAVLVDAPCSSSGTWRRNPDARLRISSASARNELSALQMQILKQAALQVRPGGRLIYATCSWCVDENEAIAEVFLGQAGGDFSQSELSLRGGNLLGYPALDSDTMFVSIFERNSNS